MKMEGDTTLPKAAGTCSAAPTLRWLRGKDLTLRPLGYEPNELPDCSTPQDHGSAGSTARQTFRENAGKLPKNSLSTESASFPLVCRFVLLRNQHLYHVAVCQPVAVPYDRAIDVHGGGYRGMAH